MVKQAEANAKEDETRRQEIETRNQLDGLVYKVEKDSKEWVDRLAADVKERLDKAVEAGKEALRTGDSAKIRTALDELNVAYSAAGASLYQNASASGRRTAAGRRAPARRQQPHEGRGGRSGLRDRGRGEEVT